MASKEKDVAKHGRVNEGDWICADKSCQNINFAWRSHCNKCGKDKGKVDTFKKAGAEIGKSAAAKSGGLFSAEDWQCHTCGNVNWARRNECNLCKSPKFGITEARTGAGGGYMERDGVEYIERDESDDEFDEFGRKKKRFRGKDVPRRESNGNKEVAKTAIEYDEDEESGEEVDLSKYDLVEDSGDEDGDLSKYDLSSDTGSESKKMGGSPDRRKRSRYSRSRSRSRSPRRRRSRASRLRSRSRDRREWSYSRSRSRGRSQSKSHDRRRSRSRSRDRRSSSRSQSRSRGRRRRQSHSRSRSRSRDKSRRSRSHDRSKDRRWSHRSRTRSRDCDRHC